MPSKSYREFIIKELLDPEYASLYAQVSLEETIKDNDIAAFKLSLRDILEADKARQSPIAAIHVSRQEVYRNLLELENLTVETAEAALKTVGIAPERDPAEIQMSV